MNIQQLSGLAVPLLFLVIFYFLLIRPQQKREKTLKEMRSAVKLGDEIVTIGGLTGKVTRVSEDDLTIEIGIDKTKITLEKWGIARVRS